MIDTTVIAPVAGSTLDAIAALLDGASIVVRSAESGTITHWTSGAEALYGWPRVEAIGRVEAELLATDPAEGREAVEAMVARTGNWEGEVQQRHRDGRALCVRRRRRGTQAQPGREQQRRASKSGGTQTAAGGKESEAHDHHGATFRKKRCSQPMFSASLM